jgi:cytochrome bd-type quinol oxidase subunit 2
METKQRFLKGQITLPSLVQIFIVIILFSVMFPAVVQPRINDYVATLDLTTSDGQLNAAGAQILPFAVLIGIIATIINQATPKREVYGYGP